LTSLRRPAPGLGEHNVEVYVDELGFDPVEVDNWAAIGLV
jgi:hypothetical protein